MIETLQAIIGDLPRGSILRDEVGEILACEWEKLVRETWGGQICECHPEVNPLQGFLQHRAWFRYNVIWSGENGKKVYDVIAPETNKE